MSRNYNPKTAILGQNVKRIRESRGWSVVYLSKKTGINRQSIARLESGIGEPQQKTIDFLATALGVSAEDLEKTTDGSSQPLPDSEALMMRRLFELEKKIAQTSAFLNEDPFVKEIRSLPGYEQNILAKAISSNKNAVIAFCKYLVL
jgi:transcriptional regulator with XRE-family HTH domain